MTVGFEPDEIALDAPTRAARLKWVVVLDAALPAGRAANAAICVAAATADRVAGLLGPDAEDPDGAAHPGLPWAGCSVLGGTAEQLAELRRRASGSDDVFVADMPTAAQATRVYADYLEQVRIDGADPLLAVSLVGPKNRVDRLTKGLDLLA
ncbi:DUF2000 domain-containing protein [Amnibacterium endophyticum]|uniref:DUF2000 domain-containing protein n=1 Tax=Amnibacterium endophyticum TaxID=2109337 RepID=A0ABW4LA63_9MICO